MWLKAGLALVVASLYGWDVDKSRLDWGLFAMTLLMGAIHPLIVLAMIAKLRTGLRGETR